MRRWELLAQRPDRIGPSRLVAMLCIPYWFFICFQGGLQKVIVAASRKKEAEAAVSEHKKIVDRAKRKVARYAGTHPETAAKSLHATELAELRAHHAEHRASMEQVTGSVDTSSAAHCCLHCCLLNTALPRPRTRGMNMKLDWEWGDAWRKLWSVLKFLADSSCLQAQTRTVNLSHPLVMIGWCTDLARWSRRRTAKGASWNISSSQRLRACMQCTFWAWAGGHQMAWSRQRCKGQVYRGIRRGKVWLGWSLVVIRVSVCSIFKRLLCYLMKMVKSTQSLDLEYFIVVVVHVPWTVQNVEDARHGSVVMLPFSNDCL